MNKSELYAAITIIILVPLMVLGLIFTIRISQPKVSPATKKLQAEYLYQLDLEHATKKYNETIK